MTIDEFIEKVCQRPMPQNKMARIRILARELAEGATEKIWGAKVDLSMARPTNSDINKYLKRRWNTNEFPPFDLLERAGYLDKSGSFLLISEKALNLLEEAASSTIFISYRRNESSTFALLVLKYLQEAGLEPFLDMALIPGEDFHKRLKERIQAQDFLILLLGKTTLKSEWVIQEIEWALEKGLEIIPIWQPRFKFIPEKWPTLSGSIKHKLANTHTIRVLEENPLAYHTAMVELLNTKFGITP